MMFKWKSKSETEADRIIEIFEIKKALDVVREYYPQAVYEEQMHNEYVFRKSDNCSSVQNYIFLDRVFTYIREKDWEYKTIVNIIDLTTQNIKIQEEFKDLFEGMKLQQESFIKLKKFMKSSLIEMYEGQQKQIANKLL